MHRAKWDGCLSVRVSDEVIVPEAAISIIGTYIHESRIAALLRRHIHGILKPKARIIMGLIMELGDA